MVLHTAIGCGGFCGKYSEGGGHEGISRSRLKKGQKLVCFQASTPPYRSTGNPECEMKCWSTEVIQPIASLTCASPNVIRLLVDGAQMSQQAGDLRESGRSLGEQANKEASADGQSGTKLPRLFVSFRGLGQRGELLQAPGQGRRGKKLVRDPSKSREANGDFRTAPAACLRSPGFDARR